MVDNSESTADRSSILYRPQTLFFLHKTMLPHVVTQDTVLLQTDLESNCLSLLCFRKQESSEARHCLSQVWRMEEKQMEWMGRARCGTEEIPNIASSNTFQNNHTCLSYFVFYCIFLITGSGITSPVTCSVKEKSALCGFCLLLLLSLDLYDSDLTVTFDLVLHPQNNRS